MNATPKPTPPIFDHEKLDVYQLELRFISWVTAVLDEAKNIAAGKSREVCDQLDRASLSALLNTAEGNGKRRGQGRAKFFDDARGSATECAACLDALAAKTILPATRIFEGKELLLRIVSMLCGLIDRYDQSGQYLHEDMGEYDNLPFPPTCPRTRTRTRTRARTKPTRKLSSSL